MRDEIDEGLNWHPIVEDGFYAALATYSHAYA